MGCDRKKITNVDSIPDLSLVSTECEPGPSATLTEALSSPKSEKNAF